MLSKASTILNARLVNIDLHTYAKFDPDNTMWFKSYSHFTNYTDGL